MKIKVLICSADGTQVVEEREVAEDWIPAPKEDAVAQDGAEMK